MNATVIDKLKAYLRQQEGVKLAPYQDTKGIRTIGVGHNMQNSPLPPDMSVYLQVHEVITLGMVEQLLEGDVEEMLIYCKEEWTDFDEFSDNRQIALADWMFNCGPGTIHEFKHANAYIEQGKWKEAAKAMLGSLWAKEVGDRARVISDMVEKG